MFAGGIVDNTFMTTPLGYQISQHIHAANPGTFQLALSWLGAAAPSERVTTMNTRNKLTLLKEHEQDFEWYPTTDEMIQVVFRHCGNLSSMLDIGAGDGRVLERIDKLCFARSQRGDEAARYERFRSSIDKYAIEKSIVHIENMPPDISIVGTDFHAQTLIDKNVDVVFCNPPYSEYEAWATQVIKEANANQVYLIMPERWSSSKLIEAALKQRDLTARVIWSGDFLDADRQARAKVDIVKIMLHVKSQSSWDKSDNDPFDVWFTEHFAGFEELKHIDDDETERPDPLKELVPGQNLVERLVELYTAEMKELGENYKTLSQLDKALLNEIGIAADEVKKALKLKIEGLKCKYWHELFDRLDKITNRLTSKSRDSMLEKLNASCNIDFSSDNAYAVVLWVIKNANQYIDDQLTEVFKELSEPECVKNYKSNLKTWEKDGWRYSRSQGEEHTHYTLEYRIISSQHCAIYDREFGGYDYPNNLYKNCHAFINNVFTIANNLGFANVASTHTKQWESNKQHSFYAINGTLLAQVRCFKNGNVHMKLDQEFIKALNVEASRLLGWIKTPQEAVDEMGIDIDFATSKFKSNLLFGVREGQRLLAG